MTKEEIIRKEIARILAENPENPVAVLRASRKQAATSPQVKFGENKQPTPLTDMAEIISRANN